MLPNTYRYFPNLGVNNPNNDKNNNNTKQNYYYTDAKEKENARKNRSRSAPAQQHIDNSRDCQRGNDGFVSIWGERESGIITSYLLVNSYAVH